MSSNSEEKKQKKEKKSSSSKEKKEKKSSSKEKKEKKSKAEKPQEKVEKKVEVVSEDDAPSKENTESELSDLEASLPTPMPSSTNTDASMTEDEEEATDADYLLLDKEAAEKALKEKKDRVVLEEKQTIKLIKKREDDEDDEVSWYSMRECLLLLLESRMILKEMIQIKFKKERIRAGLLSVNEIQDLLRAQKEDQETDWVAEIQDLKRQLVSEVRRNHNYERDLNKLDKRIALLIKNRGNIQEVLAAHGKSKKSHQNAEKSEIMSDPHKLEHYQNLFYLLQTEPKYLAALVYLMKPEQMESFLDTVILTLYGDAFSPREEYLILKLFSIAVQKEMSAITNVSDFLKADSVVPKMVITYNRRKQGLDFLKGVIGPIMKSVISKDINLELKPQMIYQALINEQEIRTGEKSNLQRNLTEDQIMDLKEVKDICNTRVEQLQQICDHFFEGVIKNLNKLPYGIRWICKQIRRIAQESFKNSSEDDILKVTGYFVYYRFVNLAIVTPDAFEIVDRELQPVARKNLVAVARVLQNLFNLSLFSGANDKWMMPLNTWIKSKLESVRDYFTDLAEVPDPEDYLQVDRYMEFMQKTKPVIIISLHEIASTHSFVLQHIDKLAKDKEDPLRVIMNDLGEAPAISSEDDREIQLTLTNRFKQDVDDEVSSAQIYAQTKELIINAFRNIPVANNDQDQTLLGILEYGRRFAKEQGQSALLEQVEKIMDNLKSLEADGKISKQDNYANLLRDIALEVANRAEVRDQQRKEIKRLNQALRNLRKHQKYLTDQITQYNEYLQDARMKHYQAHQKKKKKVKEGENPNKIGPFKFSYSALSKKGVIIDSEVPAISRKKTSFEISSEKVGVFDIVAKIAGITVEKMTLEFDDLLERNYNNIMRLELDQVTLDVNMTIHLLNKFFMK